MRRYLEEPLRKDIKDKIVLLSGPRQVGKTTLARQLVPGHVYLNYDVSEDRGIIRRLGLQIKFSSTAKDAVL